MELAVAAGITSGIGSGAAAVVLLVNRLLVRFSTSGTLLKSIVRFPAGAKPSSSAPTMPYVHVSHTELPTPLVTANATISGRAQDVVDLMCLWKKNLLDFIWNQ